MKGNLQIVALQLLSALQSCSCAEPLMLSESELSRRFISVFLHLFCSERISWSPAADLGHQKSHHQHPPLRTGRAGRRLTFFLGWLELQQAVTCRQWLPQSCLCESSCAGEGPLDQSLIQAPFFFFSVEFFPVWRRRKSSSLTADWRRRHRHLRRDGSSWIRVAGACQRAGVPSSEHGQGGGLGVVERTRSLAAVQRSGLPPYWERAEGGCPGKCGAGASGRPALSLRHWSAVYAPVSPGYR